MVSVTSTCTTHCLRVILFLPPWYPFLWNFHYSPIASPLLLIMSWVSSHGFPSWKSGTPTWLSRSAYFNHNRRRTHRAVPRNAGKSSWCMVGHDPKKNQVSLLIHSLCSTNKYEYFLLSYKRFVSLDEYWIFFQVFTSVKEIYKNNMINKGIIGNSLNLKINLMFSNT